MSNTRSIGAQAIIFSIALWLVTAMAAASVAKPVRGDSGVGFEPRQEFVAPVDAIWGTPWEPFAEPPVNFLTSALRREVSGMLLLTAAAGGIATISLGLHATGRTLAHWRDLAIRHALGAPPGSLTRHVRRDLLRPALLGILLGMVGGGLLLALQHATRPAIFAPGDGAWRAAFGAAGVAALGCALLLAALAWGLGTLAERGVRSAADLQGEHITGAPGLLLAQQALVILQQAAVLIVAFVFAVTWRDAGVASIARARTPDVQIAPAVRTALPPTGVASTTPDLWLGVGKRVDVTAFCGVCFVGQFFRPWASATVRVGAAAPGAFAAAGLRRRAGREFSTADSAGSGLVAVITQRAAHALFPSATPIGKSLRIGGLNPTNLTIVGVVEGPQPEVFGASGGEVMAVFVPLAQAPSAAAEWQGSADAVTGGAAAARAAYYRAPLAWFTRWRGALAVLVGLVATWAIVAVMLAMVRLRRREIAVRLALGATRRNLLTWLGAIALRTTALGALLGLLGATIIMVQRGGTSPTVDLLLVIAMAGVMACIAWLAAMIPAWRAAGIAPMEAMRQ